MELYIGGSFQGKLDYVKKLHPQGKICGREDFLQLLNKAAEGQKAFDDGSFIIWNEFNLCVKKLIEEGLSFDVIEGKILAVLNEQKNIAVISDEIGNGIVPIERIERDYREFTGRLLCKIAEKSESVVKITCGLGQKLK